MQIGSSWQVEIRFFYEKSTPDFRHFNQNNQIMEFFPLLAQRYPRCYNPVWKIFRYDVPAAELLCRICFYHYAFIILQRGLERWKLMKFLKIWRLF